MKKEWIMIGGKKMESNNASRWGESMKNIMANEKERITLQMNDKEENEWK